jgi:hypothetical protein
VVDDLLTEIATPQIASDEFVSFGFRKKRKSFVNSANPPSFGLQAPNNVRTNKAARAAYKRTLSFHSRHH